MAFTKDEKKKLVANYEKWLQESSAAYVMAFHNMSVKDIDELRAEAREIGGKFQFFSRLLFCFFAEDTGIFDEASIVAFSFDDAPSVAKVVDKAGSMDQFKIKGGYMDGLPMDASQILTLAKLPSMPEMRAQLLAMIMAPASQFVRTIAEPARQIAAVMKAYSEKSPAEVAG